MLRLRLFVPVSEPDFIEVGSGGAQPLRVALRRRAAARRMTLRVSGATGECVLTLPERASFAEARSFLEAQVGWIAARLARLPGRVAFTPGSAAPLRGELHRILHGSGGRGATRAVRNGDGELAIVVSGGPDGVAGRVRRFLIAQASLDLREAVGRHAGTLGVRPGRLAVRDTVSRWGSCSATGSLSFSWRLVLAPPFVLDYLAAHEVAHLRELNHSARFWRIVHDLCPRTDEAEGWLKRNGSGLHRYG